MPDSTQPQPISSTSNRWGVALAGVIMQVALGAVYAWSVFRIPLSKAFGWTISQVTFTFTLAILMLGFAAFVGGLWMRKSGPRRVRHCRRNFLRRWRFPGELLGGTSVLALLLLWISGRDRSRARLHCAGGHAGQMVP